MTTEVVVKQNEEKPVPVEVLAEAILSISEGVKKLRAGPLNERALLLLIQNAAPAMKSGRYHRTPVTTKMVNAVLQGMDALEREYLKPKKEAKK